MKAMHNTRICIYWRIMHYYSYIYANSIVECKGALSSLIT